MKKLLTVFVLATIFSTVGAAEPLYKTFKLGGRDDLSARLRFFSAEINPDLICQKNNMLPIAISSTKKTATVSDHVLREWNTTAKTVILGPDLNEVEVPLQHYSIKTYLVQSRCAGYGARGVDGNGEAVCDYYLPAYNEIEYGVKFLDTVTCDTGVEKQTIKDPRSPKSPKFPDGLSIQAFNPDRVCRWLGFEMYVSHTERYNDYRHYAAEIDSDLQVVVRKDRGNNLLTSITCAGKHVDSK